MTGIWRVRAAVLVVVGALALHAGRYFLAPPGHDHADDTVHAYFSWFAPLVVASLFVAVVHLFGRVALHRAPGTSGLPRLWVMWPLLTVALLMAHVTQELAEAYAAHRYIPQPETVFESGGWILFPLAAVVAFVIALLLRGAASLERWAAVRLVPQHGHVRSGQCAPCIETWTPSTLLLALRLGGRAPPLTLSNSQ